MCMDGKGLVGPGTATFWIFQNRTSAAEATTVGQMPNRKDLSHLADRGPVAVTGSPASALHTQLQQPWLRCQKRYAAKVPQVRSYAYLFQ